MDSTAPTTTSPYRSDLFAGKKALITGGGTGMGKSFAQQLAAHGADVVICSRKEEHLRPVAEEIGKRTGQKALWKTCDVREPDQVQAVVDLAEAEFGSLDILVNNAAGNFLVPFDAMSHNAWRSVQGIVLDGTFNMSKAAFPLLQKEGGAVTNIVATYAWGAAPFVSHSGAAKAGVLNLTRSLAVEWASHGIRVNAIAPGPVITEGASSRLFADPDAQGRIEEGVPLKRFGLVEEMSWALLYLSSPAASYVSGECLTVDGAQWLVGGHF